VICTPEAILIKAETFYVQQRIRVRIDFSEVKKNLTKLMTMVSQFQPILKLVVDEAVVARDTLFNNDNIFLPNSVPPIANYHFIPVEGYYSNATVECGMAGGQLPEPHFKTRQAMKEFRSLLLAHQILVQPMNIEVTPVGVYHGSTKALISPWSAGLVITAAVAAKVTVYNYATEQYGAPPDEEKHKYLCAISASQHLVSQQAFNRFLGTAGELERAMTDFGEQHVKIEAFLEKSVIALAAGGDTLSTLAFGTPGSIAKLRDDLEELLIPSNIIDPSFRFTDRLEALLIAFKQYAEQVRFTQKGTILISLIPSELTALGQLLNRRAPVLDDVIEISPSKASMHSIRFVDYTTGHKVIIYTVWPLISEHGLLADRYLIEERKVGFTRDVPGKRILKEEEYIYTLSDLVLPSSVSGQCFTDNAQHLICRSAPTEQVGIKRSDSCGSYIRAITRTEVAKPTSCDRNIVNSRKAFVIPASCSSGITNMNTLVSLETNKFEFDCLGQSMKRLVLNKRQFDVPQACKVTIGTETLYSNVEDTDEATYDTSSLDSLIAYANDLAKVMDNSDSMLKLALAIGLPTGSLTVVGVVLTILRKKLAKLDRCCRGKEGPRTTKNSDGASVSQRVTHTVENTVRAGSTKALAPAYEMTRLLPPASRAPIYVPNRGTVGRGRNEINAAELSIGELSLTH
jgi:hypothetical protein